MLSPYFFMMIRLFSRLADHRPFEDIFQFPEPGNIPLPVAKIVYQGALGRIRCDVEGLVKRMVGLDDFQISIEHHQGSRIEPRMLLKISIKGLSGFVFLGHGPHRRCYRQAGLNSSLPSRTAAHRLAIRIYFGIKSPKRRKAGAAQQGAGRYRR